MKPVDHLPEIHGRLIHSLMIHVPLIHVPLIHSLLGQALVLGLVLAPPSPAQAAARPSAEPLARQGAEGSSHIQHFRYDPEASFAIVALPGVPTDLQLAPDEHVTGFALGDTVQWLVEELAGHVFVKPLKPALFTAGTLVTDRRTYQLTLKSVLAGDDWMQRVTWVYPDLIVLRTPPAPLPHGAEWTAPAGRVVATPGGTVPVFSGTSAGAGATAGPAAGAASRGLPAGITVPGPGDSHALPPTEGLDPTRLDFDYRLVGTAPFRPQVVFDDGHSMWLRIPPHESLPALFQAGEDGLVLVNYAVRGDWVVIPRILPRLVLKLGKSEVDIQRHASGRSAEGGQHAPW